MSGFRAVADARLGISRGTAIRTLVLLGLGASAAATTLSLMQRNGEPTMITTESQASISTATSEHKVLGNGECDCLPLWECMQTKGANCSDLDNALRECMKAHKLSP